MSSDELTDIADAIIDALNESGWDGSGRPGLAACAVFELIEARYVPASAVNDLAQQWARQANSGDRTAQWFVANLCALTRRETP